MSAVMENPEDVVVEERDAQPTLSIRATIPVAQLTQAQGECLRELWASIDKRALRPAGPPFVRYHTFGETETDLEVGIPVGEATSGEGRIGAGALPGGAAARTWHLGSHERLGDAYTRLATWIQENGREPNGAAWEVYNWIDPSVAPDPSAWPPPTEWRTELIQPIR